MLEHGKADAIPESPVFETYLEAHQEAVRRRQGGSNGMVTRVVRSPYGGYVIRTWPLELLAEPELRHVTAFLGNRLERSPNPCGRRVLPELGWQADGGRHVAGESPQERRR